jgi:short-subunit dehydrogenase
VRVLVSTGAVVFGTARNLEKAKQVLGSVLDCQVAFHRLDRYHQTYAEDFLKQSSRLYVLINNAAVGNREKQTNECC